MKRVGAQATAGGSQLLCRCSFLRETSVASPGSKVICRRRTENETHRAGGYPGWLDSVCVDVCGARCTRDRRNGRGRDSKRSSCEERDARSNTRSRSEEHTSELQSHSDLVCRLLLEKKKTDGG